MPEKKANHYIPKVILKNWVVNNHLGRNGVYTFDIKRSKAYFSSAQGKRAFSFAIAEDVYVPMIDNKRYLNLENWLGTLESTFAKMVTVVTSKLDLPMFKTQTDLNQLKLALISFKHRSKHVIEKNTSFAIANPSIVKNIYSSAQKDIKTLMLENVVNATVHDTLEFGNIEIIAGISEHKKLIFSDMPFLEKVTDNFNFLPITSSIFIAFRPTEGESTYKRIKVDDKMIESLNNPIARNAHNWIIADNEDQIKQYLPLAIDCKDSESIYVASKYLFKGVSFNNHDEKIDL